MEEFGVSDFGLAISIRHTNMDKLKPFGTQDYLAKDILGFTNCSIGKTGTHTDIFAAGIIICDIIIGKLLFENCSFFQIFYPY